MEFVRIVKQMVRDRIFTKPENCQHVERGRNVRIMTVLLNIVFAPLIRRFRFRNCLIGLAAVSLQSDIKISAIVERLFLDFPSLIKKLVVKIYGF